MLEGQTTGIRYRQDSGRSRKRRRYKDQRKHVYGVNSGLDNRCFIYLEMEQSGSRGDWKNNEELFYMQYGNSFCKGLKSVGFTNLNLRRVIGNKIVF